MTIFYRGAGTGTYWNINDARLSGFTARNAGMVHTVDRVIQHVYGGDTDSPYVSLSLSYGVALNYALEMGTVQPTVLNPSFVYEVEINAAHGVDLVDPVKEIADGAPPPLSALHYQHNGAPIVLLGVVSPWLSAFLHTPVPMPPGSTTSPPILNVSPHLWGFVAALRDAEILARGAVPSACVTKRHGVY
jgi:hypothetical protein